MLDVNDIAELQRGSDALREAIQEYVAMRVRTARLRSHRITVLCTASIIKAWRCIKCQATGEIHSGCGEAMVEAIRAQHRRKRRIEGCQFDQEAILVSPTSPAGSSAAPVPVLTAGAAG